MGKKYLYLNTLLISLILLSFLYIRFIILLPLISAYVIVYIITYKKRSIILLFILTLSLFFNFNLSKDDINPEFHHRATVVNVYNTSATVKEDRHIYYIMKIDIPLVKGDVIEYNTYYKTDVEKGSFDLFYRSTKAIAYGYAANEKVMQHKEDVRNRIYFNLVNENSWFSNTTLLLLYGQENGVGVNLKNMVTRMGVTHLFVVSGFHISLFYILTEKFTNKIIKDRKMNSLLSFIISLSFLYLVYFPPTGIRALITLLIIRTYRTDKVESLCITGLIFFVINPWILFSNSMILSFSITLSIYLFRPSEVSLSDAITLSMFAFFISLPTVSTWQTEHNLFSPLLSLVMTPIVSFMYITCLVFLPFHNLWGLINPLFVLFYLIISIFSSLVLQFDVGMLNMYEQIVLTSLCVFYIGLMKEQKWSILSSFFSIAILLFLI